MKFPVELTLMTELSPPHDWLTVCQTAKTRPGLQTMAGLDSLEHHVKQSVGHSYNTELAAVSSVANASLPSHQTQVAPTQRTTRVQTQNE